MSSNPVIYWELASHDALKTVEFLKKVFDWDFEYDKVDDLDTKVKLIEENGGFIVDPPLDLPGGSRICLFNEPSGVTLAMIQSAKK